MLRKDKLVNSILKVARTASAASLDVNFDAAGNTEATSAIVLFETAQDNVVIAAVDVEANIGAIATVETVTRDASKILAIKINPVEMRYWRITPDDASAYTVIYCNDRVEPALPSTVVVGELEITR